MATEEKTYLLPLFILLFLLFWSPGGPNLELEDNAVRREREEEPVVQFEKAEEKIAEASSIYYDCQQIVFLEEILETNGEEKREEYEKALKNCRQGKDFYEKMEKLVMEEELRSLREDLLTLADEINQFSVAITITGDRSTETRENAREKIPPQIRFLREELSEKTEETGE